MISEQESRLLLLQSFKYKTDVDRIELLGREYSVIVKDIKKLIQEGCVIFENNTYTLTKKGDKEIRDLNKKLGRKGISYFLSPYYEFRTSSISSGDVYVPILTKKVERGL